MKYCKYCGSRIDADSMFCSGCGKSLSTAPTQTKIPTEGTSAPDVVITPGSCPNCGSTSYQTTQTQDFQIKRPRVCNNCGNSYRTVEDIEKDIEYCKTAIAPIIACGIGGFILFLVLASAFDVWKTFENWDWASDDKKTLSIAIIIIAIAVCSAVIPSLTKRGREIDELTEERDHLEAKNRALDVKNASTIPEYQAVYKATNSQVGKNNSETSVKYLTAVPTVRDFDRLIEVSGLREFILENDENDITYNAFRLNIRNKFEDLIKESLPANSKLFISKKGFIGVKVKLSYGNGTLSCVMNFICQ